MRIAKIILIASIAAFVSLPVLGVSVISQVTTNSPGLPFVVAVQDAGTNKLFRVTIETKAPVGNPGTWTVGLSIYAGTNRVSWRSIEPLQPVGATSATARIVYEFALPAQEWRDAKCDVTYNLTGYPAFVAQWFYLRDFAATK